MSNYLVIQSQLFDEMTTETKRPTVGIDHPTVVPTNFAIDEPDDEAAKPTPSI